MTPLSPVRSLQLAWLGRLSGLAALVLVTSLAVATAQPSAPPPPAAPASDDPAGDVAWIEVNTNGERPEINIHLKPGLGADAARRAADNADFEPSGDTGATRLVVHHEGGMLKRFVRSKSNRRSGAARDTTEVFDVAEVQPELIGGVAGIQDRLVYPPLQRRAGIEGRTILQFVVSKTGTVTDLQVVRSSGDEALDQSAREAVQSARFQPGTQRGEPVRVRFSLPITFRLDASQPVGPASGGIAAQSEPDEDGIFNVAEVQPELIGGVASIQPVYPPLARQAGIEGRVIVQFVVDTDGSTTDAQVVRSPDDMLSQAALEAVRTLRFEPARNRGQAVKVRFALPITFRLPGPDGAAERPDDRLVVGSTRGPSIFGDTEYSGDLESFVDQARTIREFVEAMIRSEVAAGADPFRDLAPGTARVRFRVQEGGTLLIESVDASSPVMERYARLRALTTHFRGEAIGRTGSMTVTVSRVE